MELQELDPPGAYLAGSEWVDLDHPSLRELEGQLVTPGLTPIQRAERIYHFVRDQIRHSVDAGDSQVTLKASEVLAEGTGLCYSKAHLAAALLRRSGIPTGLCYQRLRDGQRLVLHGLIAVKLNDAWHRLDVRGNKPGVEAEFSLAAEQLAFTPVPSAGEADLGQLWAAPAPAVVERLSQAADLDSLLLPAEPVEPSPRIPPATIHVSAVCLRDAQGRILTVRKRGTSKWMLVGGKPEADESALDCAIREVGEELGVGLDPARMVLLGVFDTVAANEGVPLRATVFTTDQRVRPQLQAELAALQWSELDDPGPNQAPLNTELVFPLLLAADSF